MKAVELFRYAPTVFAAPPWEATYRNDAERKQSFDEAVATYRVVVDACVEAGYDVVDLPEATIEERVAFILRQISSETPSR
jgi:predicted ATPase